MDGGKKEIRKGNDLTQGPVGMTILRFAGPLLVGNILQQLYNFTDSIIVGRFVGKEALAAVSASYFIYYFIVSFVIGIGSGTSVVVSQYFGAKQFDKVQQAFSSFFLFMLAGGILLSIGGIVFAEHIFRMVQTPEEVIPGAVRYFRIYIGGTFLFVMFSSVISILRGVGESLRPMLFILLSAILNVLLDLLFVVVFGWGIEGAARATVIAQGTAVCVALYYVNERHPLFSLKKKDMLFDAAVFRQELRIGLPSSGQQCAISLGLMALLGIVNTFGTDTLTAYGAAGKIDTIITQAILALSSALATFCGQNIGAGQLSRVRQGVRFALLFNLVFGMTMFIILYFFGDTLMLAFTSDADVVRIGHEYLIIIGSFFFIHGGLNVFNGALRGAGDTLFPMFVSLSCLWLIRIPLAYYFSGMWGETGIWWAINVSLGIGLCMAAIYYRMGKWKKKSVFH